jgi:hypothetical protein
MDIKAILERELEAYAGEGANGHAILTQSQHGREYTIVVHAVAQKKSFTFMSLSVALDGETIIIYEDRNDPPLVESLIQVGIPRDKIICVYVGEEIPVSA